MAMSEGILAPLDKKNKISASKNIPENIPNGYLAQPRDDPSSNKA